MASFSWALERLKEEKKVRRVAWQNQACAWKDCYLVIQREEPVTWNWIIKVLPLGDAFCDSDYNPTIEDDILADDWEIA